MFEALAAREQFVIKGVMQRCKLVDMNVNFTRRNDHLRRAIRTIAASDIGLVLLKTLYMA